MEWQQSLEYTHPHKWEVVIPDEWTKATCVCVDTEGWESPCVQLAGWRVRVQGAEVASTCSGGNWSAYSKDTHTSCSPEGKNRIEKKKRLLLQGRHVRIPKKHTFAELGQTKGAKHMTGCNKGERQREQNNAECGDLEKLSTDRGASHCSARSWVWVCEHATGFWIDRYEHKRTHQEPTTCTTLCWLNKSVMIHLNASVDRNYLQFPFPSLKKDIVLINLSAGI